MRILFSFILAIMLSLNGAYALSVGICDALEQEPTPQHLNHLGHHQHHIQDADKKSPDKNGKVHCHDHIHPNFSYIPPNYLPVLPFNVASCLHPTVSAIFVSTTLLPPERPPRAALA